MIRSWKKYDKYVWIKSSIFFSGLIKLLYIWKRLCHILNNTFWIENNYKYGRAGLVEYSGTLGNSNILKTIQDTFEKLLWRNSPYGRQHRGETHIENTTTKKFWYQIARTRGGLEVGVNVFKTIFRRFVTFRIDLSVVNHHFYRSSVWRRKYYKSFISYL